MGGKDTAAAGPPSLRGGESGRLEGGQVRLRARVRGLPRELEDGRERVRQGYRREAAGVVPAPDAFGPEVDSAAGVLLPRVQHNARGGGGAPRVPRNIRFPA